MQVMSKFVKAIQMRYRCASIIWLHDGVWLDTVVSAADIAKAEQEAVDEVFPCCTHTERLFRIRSLATDYSQVVHDRLHHAHFDDGGHERLQLVSFVMF